MNRLGTQTLADLYDCEPARLDDPKAVEDVMLEAARLAGATIVGHSFHRFNPHGISGVIILAESHLAIHTWPEHQYAAIDLFTCGTTMVTDACIAYLIEAFGSTRNTTTCLPRGEMPSGRGAAQ